MELKEDSDVPEEFPASPYQVLQQIPEEAVGVAGEPIQNNMSSSPNLPPLGSGHRRSRSEVVSSVHNRRRNVGFQKWKSHVQRASRWGNNAQKENQGSDFNPEILADQKRHAMADAAAQFLTVMRRYLESLRSELRSHTITSVKSNNDRVSLLLKDSFIDSFPIRDQSFV